MRVFSGRGQFANAAPGARPPLGLGEVAAAMAEPAEGLVLRLRPGGLLERDQRLDATGFFVLVGRGARTTAVVAVVVVVVVLGGGGGLFAIRAGA